MSLNDDLCKVAGLVSKQGEVFQNHVIDLVRDLIADRQFKEFVLRQNIKVREAIADFKNVELARLPIGPAPATWLASLLSDLEAGEEPPHAAEVLDILIGEIIHRRKWDEVMAKYPDTLNILKSRISESED